MGYQLPKLDVIGETVGGESVSCTDIQDVTSELSHKSQSRFNFGATMDQAKALYAERKEGNAAAMTLQVTKMLKEDVFL